MPKLAKFYFLCLLSEIILKNTLENKDLLDLRKLKLNDFPCIANYLSNVCKEFS